MLNGEPEGYWRNYYQNGLLKSEGNRKNHQLDSLWKFYSQSGALTRTVNYKKGYKNGYSLSYNHDTIIIKEELFLNDTLQRLRKFHQNGKLKYILPFKNGKKNGSAFEFDTAGVEKIWWNYKNNQSEKYVINRFDAQGKRSGKWMTFHDNILRTEVGYSRGVKHGVEKIFNKKGDLKQINKYEKGVLITDVNNIKVIDQKKTFSTNGIIHKSGGFNERGQPHGVHRVFNDKGEVESSKVFKNGILESEGVVKKSGEKDGFWIYYYSSGEKLSEGFYRNNKKYGEWNYYYKNGYLESEGIYGSDGKEDGVWKEYNENGMLREETHFSNGLYDGTFKAYNDSGVIVIQGNYIEDYEDGEWLYQIGDHTEYGTYIDGLKSGEWKSYYNKKQLVFKGNFQNGLPVGKHLYWYENGNLKRVGEYISGRREGEWLYYSKKGSLLMVVEYNNGLEKSYNGYSIDPAHEMDDYIEYEQTGYRWLD